MTRDHATSSSPFSLATVRNNPILPRNLAESTSRLPEKVDEFLRIHHNKDLIYSDLKGLSEWYCGRLEDFRASVKGWPDDRRGSPDDAFVIAAKK